MAFPIRNKARTNLIFGLIGVGIAVVLLAGAGVGTARSGPGMGAIPVLGWIAISGGLGIYYLLNAQPRTLDVVGNYLELRTGAQLEGRIPLKIIDTISTEFAHRKHELVPEGILLKLFDNNDPETVWPTFAISENGYVLHLRDPGWDRSLNQVLNDLRDAQIDYMRANHLLPPEENETNPFDFR